MKKNFFFKIFLPSSTSITTSFFLFGGIFPCLGHVFLSFFSVHFCLLFIHELLSVRSWYTQKGPCQKARLHTHTLIGTGVSLFRLLKDRTPWQPWKGHSLLDCNQEPEETNNGLVNQMPINVRLKRNKFVCRPHTQMPFCWTGWSLRVSKGCKKNPKLWLDTYHHAVVAR